MVGKYPKRFSHNDFWFSHWLRSRASKFLPVLLLVFFLFGNLTFACDELDVDDCSNQQSSAEFYSLNYNQELTSTPVERNEFHTCRKGKEDTDNPNLEIKRSRHQFEILMSIRSSEVLFSSEISLPSTSPCKTLFAPRPPPLFPSQA
jgi:hypothetical protein